MCVHVYWRTKVWNIDINFVVFKIFFLCLVKFEVLGYKNTKKLLRSIFISDPQINLNRLGCAKKMTEMRSIAVEGHRVWLCICMIFSLQPVVIPFGIAAVGPGFIFQDDNA